MRSNTWSLLALREQCCWIESCGGELPLSPDCTVFGRIRACMVNCPHRFLSLMYIFIPQIPTGIVSRRVPPKCPACCWASERLLCPTASLIRIHSIHSDSGVPPTPLTPLPSLSCYPRDENRCPAQASSLQCAGRSQRGSQTCLKCAPRDGYPAC